MEAELHHGGKAKERKLMVGQIIAHGSRKYALACIAIWLRELDAHPRQFVFHLHRGGASHKMHASPRTSDAQLTHHIDREVECAISLGARARVYQVLDIHARLLSIIGIVQSEGVHDAVASSTIWTSARASSYSQSGHKELQRRVCRSRALPIVESEPWRLCSFSLSRSSARARLSCSLCLFAALSWAPSSISMTSSRPS